MSSNRGVPLVVMLALAAIVAPLCSATGSGSSGTGSSGPGSSGNAMQTTTALRGRSHWQSARSAPVASAAATTTTTSPCEYKELMVNLHDRVGILATLDEDLRNRLESIDKKIVQFEAANLARLDSLSLQQTDFLKRLDSMEHIGRLTRREVEELIEMSVSRVPRQVEAQPTSLDDQDKLGSLAVLLTSTRNAVQDLQLQLQMNITKLMQVTSTLQRRLNNLQRRQQAGPPHLFAGSVGGQLQPQATSCAQGVPTTGGVLKLQLTPASEPFYVRCDETTLGGGWTVIMNRDSGDVNFQRDWLEYRAGFGNLAGEFFIGLDKLHALTASAVHELVVLLEDFEGVQRYAKYSAFAIGNEHEAYALKLLGAYEGSAGDAMTYHAGSKFSTFDNDNDGCVDCNCAQAHAGAWWYNWCEMSNLHGKYFKTDYDKAPTYQGVYWHQFHGPNYSLKMVRMMIRPVEADPELRR